MAMQVVKVTLSTKRVVLLRELKISDTESAAQEVAGRSNGDANLLSLLMQKALVKNLLVQVDGKAVSAVEREDLDSLFKLGEYNQLMQAIKMMTGGDESEKKPLLEVASIGDN